MDRIKYLVEKFELIPHPEGGYFKEVYRSKDIIPQSGLKGFTGDRNFCTSIYFLLTSENFSAFHRIKQDEIWHFYEGSSLSVHVIYPDGSYIKHKVGLNYDNGEEPQLVVPAGCWFASEVEEKDSICLVGCTVAPGFDFEDFELASKDELIKEYPQHNEIITKLTRQ